MEFDWNRILKGQGAPEPVPMAPPPRRADTERRAIRRPIESRQPMAVAEPPIRAPLPARELPPPRPEPPYATSERSSAAASVTDPVPELGLLPVADAPVTAAHGRLGAEGVLRLRARYAEMLARISERVTEEARREELKSDAERLNPDTWVTDDEVTAGLEAYEAVLESLRAVVGQGRRRRRRGGQGRDAEPDEAPAACAADGAGHGAPAPGAYEPSSPLRPPEPV